MKSLASNGVDGATAALIERAVARMHKEYGPQGWWPVRSERRQFARSDGAREQRGYHPGEFGFPRTRRGRWEITCGAVLTQNTAWTNVERAMLSLEQADVVTPEAILDCSRSALAELIRPAGYFNQKSEYLRHVARWFRAQDRAITRADRTEARLREVRPQLLAVKGVGPETADAILLYAYRLPTFVVDAYTRRVFGRLEIVTADMGYEAVRQLFETVLRDSNVATTVHSWQEAHALIVEHAKQHHRKNADPTTDFLLELTSNRSSPKKRPGEQ